uniref:Uncharacterized protein n=1 Tax=Rhizophora mucronata TaxID=61149 RepID=A0A2P2NKG5_RHIMU
MFIKGINYELQQKEPEQEVVKCKFNSFGLINNLCDVDHGEFFLVVKLILL